MRNQFAALALLSGAAFVVAAPLFAQETAPQSSNSAAPAEAGSGSAQQDATAQAPAEQNDSAAQAPAQPAQNGTAPQGQSTAQSPNF